MNWRDKSGHSQWWMDESIEKLQRILGIHEHHDWFGLFIRFKMNFPLLLLISSYIITGRQLFSLLTQNISKTYSIIEIYFHVTLFDVTRQTFNVCPNNERRVIESGDRMGEVERVWVWDRKTIPECNVEWHCWRALTAISVKAFHRTSYRLWCRIDICGW